MFGIHIKNLLSQNQYWKQETPVNGMKNYMIIYLYENICSVSV